MSNCSTSCCLPFIGYADPCKVSFQLLENEFPTPLVYNAMLQDDKGNLIKAGVNAQNELVFTNLNEKALCTVSFYVDGQILPICVNGQRVEAFQFRTAFGILDFGDTVAFEINCPPIPA